MKQVSIGVDLGGTRIRAARLDEHLNIEERHETLTRGADGFEATLQRIKDLIARVMPADVSRLQGIGVSAPGPVNSEAGLVVKATNVPGWDNIPLGQILEDEFAVPAYIGNDANVAALAEVARGAARGARHVIYITVSTGIGGGIISHGRLILGREGLAGEIGHTILVIDGDRVSSLELEAAGPSLARQARERIAAGAESQLSQMAGGDLSLIDGKLVGQAAQAGDPLALEIVTRGGRMVGLGVVSLLHTFNPEVVVIGGGVSNLGPLLFNPLRQAVADHVLVPAYVRDLRIEAAELGEDVSIIGAAALVLTRGGQDDVNQVVARINA